MTVIREYISGHTSRSRIIPDEILVQERALSNGRATSSGGKRAAERNRNLKPFGAREDFAEPIAGRGLGG